MEQKKKRAESGTGMKSANAGKTETDTQDISPGPSAHPEATQPVLSKGKWARRTITTGHHGNGRDPLTETDKIKCSL